MPAIEAARYMAAKRNFERFNLMVDYGVRRLPKSLSMIWLVLLRHADADGFTFVSAEGVRKKLGIKDVRSVELAFAALRERGFLSHAMRLPGRGERLFRRVLLPLDIAALGKASKPEDLSGPTSGFVGQNLPPGGG